MSQQGDGRERQARAATNQSLFRDVNERVKDVNDRFYAYTSLSDWVCECAEVGCVERLELTTTEYERVRADGARFFVAPNDEHVWPEVEQVVERQHGYWVVEKIELGAEIARRKDPRAGGTVSLHT
jgi:hypothetical protein